MKVITKRTVSVLLALMLAMTMFVAMPTKAFAATVGDLLFDDLTPTEDKLVAEGWAWDLDTLTLTLNGLDLEGRIELPDGSKIVLQGENFVATVVEDYPDINSIYCDGDLTIEGEGSLTITCTSADGFEGPTNGIWADGDLVILGGILDVFANNIAIGAVYNTTITGDAIYVEGAFFGIGAGDVLTISGCSIETKDCYYGLYADIGDVIIEGDCELEIGAVIGICANGFIMGPESLGAFADDAIVAASFEPSASVLITGGTINIVADWFGIEALNDITISNAVITIAIAGDDEYVDFEFNYAAPLGIASWEGDITIESGSITIDPAEPEGWYQDGIRAENGTVLISGGTITINNADSDGIHAQNGSVLISGGTVTINNADDDGIQALFIIIAGGTVVISECGYGLYSPFDADDDDDLIGPFALEGSALATLDTITTIWIKGGTVTITVESDGILAGEDVDVVISGGTVTITAGDDGIDSDGNVILSGGNLTILADDNGIWAYLDIMFCGSIVDITSLEYDAVYSIDGIITFTAGSGTIKTLWDHGDDYWAAKSETGITVGDGIVVLGWDGSKYTVKSAVGAFDFGDDGAPWFWYTFVKDADKDVVLLNIWFGPVETPPTGDSGGMVGLIVTLVALGLGGLFIVVGARRRQSVS